MNQYVVRLGQRSQMLATPVFDRIMNWKIALAFKPRYEREPFAELERDGAPDGFTLSQKTDHRALDLQSDWSLPARRTAVAGNIRIRWVQQTSRGNNHQSRTQ